MSISRRGLIAAAAFLVPSALALPFAGGTPTALPTLSATLPGDVAKGADAAAIDQFSWESFVALNWPSDGSPIGKGADDVATWQFWKSDSDILVPDGQVPIPFSQPSPVPAPCTQVGPPGARILTHDTKMGRLGDFLTPGDGPLIDQNGEYVRFEILVNEAMYDFILTNKLYSVAGQKAYSPGGTVTFPWGVRGGPAGAIMLKVAWKILGKGDDTKRFHTAMAYLYNPTTNPQCQLRLVGMVGMHISQKTENAPQWVWSTFEHADNAPLAGSTGSGHYSFNDGNVKNRALGCDGVSCNLQPPGRWDPNAGNKTPTEAVRLTDFTATAMAQNAAYAAALKAVNPHAVFANYRLAGTQFPSDVNSKSDAAGVPLPTFLANTTMETYLQGAVPGTSSNCGGCHASANMSDSRLSDFTFILSRVGMK